MRNAAHRRPQPAESPPPPYPCLRVFPEPRRCHRWITRSALVMPDSNPSKSSPAEPFSPSPASYSPHHHKTEPPARYSTAHTPRRPRSFDLRSAPRIRSRVPLRPSRAIKIQRLRSAHTTSAYQFCIRAPRFIRNQPAVRSYSKIITQRPCFLALSPLSSLEIGPAVQVRSFCGLDPEALV